MATKTFTKSAHVIGSNLHSSSPLTHEAARELVCVLCLNERGEKAHRRILKHHPREKEADGHQFAHLAEENIIQRWVPRYNSSNPLMPAGLCKRCLFLVNDFRDGKDIDHLLLLPEDYKCNGYHAPTRSVEGVVCWCTWCKLARMNGCQWRAFQFARKARSRAKLKKQAGEGLGGFARTVSKEFLQMYRSTVASSPEVTMAWITQPQELWLKIY